MHSLDTKEKVTHTWQWRKVQDIYELLCTFRYSAIYLGSICPSP